MGLFSVAERKKAKLRLALCGPSGSGKIHSALHVAAGLCPGGNIFVINTEHDSATLETGKTGIPEFFHAPLTPPFTPRRYIEYIKAAEAEGAEVIIIDSLSHAWSGSGGVLDMHDNATKAQRGNNSWAAWREVTPEHNALVDAMLQSQCHVIATFSSLSIERGLNTSSPWFSICRWKGTWPQPARTGRACSTVSTSCPRLKQGDSFWNGSRAEPTLWKRASACCRSSRPTWTPLNSPFTSRTGGRSTSRSSRASCLSIDYCASRKRVLMRQAA